MNSQAQDNIRQLLYDQISNNDICHMDILEYANAEDPVLDLISDIISDLSNADLSDAIVRILADKQNKQEQNPTDRYRNLINQAFNDAEQNGESSEVYCELLELATARVVAAIS